ncbi:tRNA (adenosine(37)-N6)-threonylcarbamoyltransferase complex dimerization subunit type 1 TsaB [Clostridium paraputrificum]|uniref:tRNA (adenosine(37)-N6)-threonylcarbamoyltransferase complex dimerization subunit type 1 TsaB n=1 Tax=Clostridium TaxID=1485 RepID=UPI000665C692|nr:MULTISPECIES: tRNA (adenosine(37)-N6)-threonylcarbamoyltransferase complex dimerization subunit type 1 TsaB [Clostridium]MDB2076089.1 tRNA (adenosine(37)-N6)-threonylcarbamoyltransferase complex dimerization subunit type 1 TsaB [Clostridium paraputrificum]MDB2079453.1 tRNA (adenosine(37)-N6)-threonylcarbamoyltransferase complex dimerization subunit type 1 TsaB [Clostridium paraputrificum]MDB2084378.1 tRNA (adenosine(37)-N6)-threonylcarbamoyltransferase complex dimerization subunit type 1 TsaB
MIVLSIDSSSKVATVALLNDDTLLGEYVINDKREHSVLLMPMIENLLKDCELTINDIDGFVVSKGPGSFTGLRIGMATIKGLSFGANKPYISLSSLDGLAYSLSYFNGIICPIMDALRENVYTALYKNEDGEFKNIMEPTPMELPDLLEMLKEKNEEVIFTGDGLLKHKEYIKVNFPNAKFASNHVSLTRASSIGELGLNLLKQGIKDDPNSAPVYLKKPQAERELEKRMRMSE